MTGFDDKSIFTLGTGNRTIEEFIRILKSYEIEMVVDLRRFPTSKFPHFKKDTLSQSLGEAGFGYYFLREELGGYRRGGFEAYTGTYEYLRGLELLERMAGRLRCAVCCAERLPWRCHRHFIARSLQERGWKVMHIIEEGRVWEDKIPPPE